MPRSSLPTAIASGFRPLPRPEMAHTEIGRDLLERFAEQCAEVANLDKTPKLEGRMMSIFLSPKTGK